MPRFRDNAYSLSVLQKLETSQVPQNKLCFPPGPKLRSRFAHLVKQPQASLLMPGKYTHDADAGWLAAAGSASADAATDNAADIQVQVISQNVGPTVSQGAGSNENAPNLLPRVEEAPEQPRRIAKMRSRPFRIPR